MSYNKKIGGILIENSIKGDGTITSVVGLGLNINQNEFENLPRASSLAVICNSNFDKEEILSLIIAKLEEMISLYKEKEASIWEDYSEKLFKNKNLKTIQGLFLTRFMFYETDHTEEFLNNEFLLKN